MKIEVNSIRDELVVDNIKVNWNVIHALITANPHKFFRFVKDGDLINIEQFEFESIEKLITR